METVITESNISEVLSSGKPVVIDFWAPWCGPCRMLGPVVEEVAAEIGDKAVVGKCNVDENDSLAVRFGIRNIPALLYFKNGEMVDRTVGLVSKQDIISKIDGLL